MKLAWLKCEKEPVNRFEQVLYDGLATEVASAVARRFFNLNLASKLIAFSDEHNNASHRVLEKLGMRLSGRRNVGGAEALVFEINDKEFFAND